MTIIYVPYTAGIAPITIDEMWAADMRTTEVHRSTDWDGLSGTFDEYTNNGGGARPNLVEGQEDYVFTDNDGDSSYAYKVRHRSADGKLTDFSPIIVVADTLDTAMYAQAVWGKYVHPDGYAGDWVKFEPRQVRWTASRMSAQGNQPYVSGTDYIGEVALLFKNSTGAWSGVDLTGVTEIVMTVTTKRGVAVTTRKLTDANIAVMDQATDHADGGTRGHIRFTFADTDTPDDGEHDVDCKVTFSDGDVAEQFSGKFEIMP